MMAKQTILQLDNLRVSYLGAGLGVHDVSLQVRAGQIVALLGVNGAGKTSTLRAITGFLPFETARMLVGQVSFEGVNVSRLLPYKRVLLGISAVPEQSKVFRQLTVSENLEVASRHKGGAAHRAATQEIFDLFPALTSRRGQRAGYLSGGERQMLGIGRALMTRPKLLLADEVSLGIAPKLVVTMLDALCRINKDKKISILLVEQNAAAALRIADYVYILENGRVAAQGTPAELLRTDGLQSVYLGIGTRRVGGWRSGGLRGPFMLNIESVDLRFGGTQALNNVTFSIAEGETFGIIGPNGAGKSSLLNVVNGYYKPRSGRASYFGKDLKAYAPHQIARLGIARTFQNIELSPDSTVLQNVMLGRHLHFRSNLVTEVFRIGPYSSQERQNRERVEEVLHFFNLYELRNHPVSDLPYGRQKLIELARAVAMEPKLLLLDEPTAGMTGEERALIAKQIRNLKTRGNMTLVIIEHDAGFIRELTSRVVVLDFGQVIALGETHEVMERPEVVEAYLGMSEGALRDLQSMAFAKTESRLGLV